MSFVSHDLNGRSTIARLLQNRELLRIAGFRIVRMSRSSRAGLASHVGSRSFDHAHFLAGRTTMEICDHRSCELRSNGLRGYRELRLSL